MSGRMSGSAQGALMAGQVRAAKIDTPEFKRDMAELKVVIKDMHLDELTAQIDRNALAEVQAIREGKGRALTEP
jgi:hypothetical protein